VNKSDLIARMTERLSGDRTAAVAAVNGVLEEIEGSVARGERVSLTGFGTFDRRERAAFTGRNPRTGETIQVGPSVVPVFRAGAGFRTVVTQAGDLAIPPAPAAVEGSVGNGNGAKSRPASSASAVRTAVVDEEAPAGKKKSGKKRDEAGVKGGKGGHKGSKKAAKKAKSSR
jgi:DNA-binding protein HU-beta